MQGKAMSKLKRVSSKHAQAASRLESELSEADALIRRKAWAKARELLESIEKRHPNRPEVLSNLAYVYHQTNDRANYQRVCECLVKLAPDDPEALLSLAGAYLDNLRLALALRTFQRFLDRWPNHERAQEARGLPDSARSWLEMWERLDPDSPNLDSCRRQVGRLAR